MSESSSSPVHPLTSKRRTQSSRIIRMHRPSIGNLLLCVNVFITCGINLSSSLKILMLDVPSPAIVGESVELTCSYDLEGDKLYSVKWYKNDAEFYRYVPKDWPPGQFLPMNGIRVDLSRSNKRSVYLKHVDLFSEGIYRCEVSAEAPSFNTAEMEKEMKVYVLPTEGPRIFGTRSTSKVGDVVSINCTSTKSKPAAVLKWFVNDNPVDATKIGSDYETILSTQQDNEGLEISSLALKFILTERHFNHGVMRLKCTASIGRMYTMRTEVLVVSGDEEEQESYRLKAIENLSQVRSSAASHHRHPHLSNVLMLVWSFVLFFLLSISPLSTCSRFLLPSCYSPSSCSSESSLNSSHRRERIRDPIRPAIDHPISESNFVMKN